MSATCAQRCITGCWRGRPADASCCASTTPTRSAARSGSSRRSASDLAWLGLKPDGEERQSERFDLYEARVCAAGRGRAHLPRLRERAGARPQAQGAARARAAADLRPRGAGAERCRACGAWRRRACDRTGASGSTMTRRSSGTTDPRPAAFRRGEHVRPGGAPRRRIVALHAAERDRRRRHGRDRCAARRGPCVEHRAAASDVHRAGGGAARASRTRRCSSGRRANCPSGWARSASTHFREAGIEPAAIRRAARTAGDVAIRSSRARATRR